MHEMSLMNGLMNHLQRLAVTHDAEHVTAIRVKVGALTHFSKEHFLEHFAYASRGTVAEGAKVEVELLDDEHDPNANSIFLDEFDISYAD